MSDKTLKVTDRRMFTPDGELREDFSHLRDVPPEARPPEARPPEARPPEAPQPGAPQPRAPQPGAPQPRAPQPGAPQPGAPQPGARQPEAWPLAADPPDPDAPAFFDLVGLLAEPAAHYMQEAHAAPPQQASQSLALARLHIDLLKVLQDKTRGNLTAEEKAMLDDVVYQLRSGFVGLGR